MVKNLWVVMNKIAKVADSCENKKQLAIADTYNRLLIEKHIKEKLKESSNVLYKVSCGDLKDKLEEYTDDLLINKMDEL